jgi:hypothetical protein
MHFLFDLDFHQPRVKGSKSLSSKRSTRLRTMVACAIAFVFTLTSAVASHAQALTASLELPNSPGFTRVLEQAPQQAPQSPQTGTSVITGIVLDVNQGIVPGAKVTLAAVGISGEREVIADSEAKFTFNNLPAGRYTFTITSPGLQTFVSNEIPLKEGQLHEVPRIALPIATASTDITVHVTERQLADEQIEAEMHQRVLGILPNFYSSYVWDAAPLQSKQKFRMAVRARSDPFVFITTGIVAGVQQWRGTPKGFGDDFAGYAQRYGAAFATGTLSRFFGSAIYPVIFHQDPRYFYKGSGTVGYRIYYAMSRSIITRGDNGKSQPNYSHILGGMTAGAISNLYHPGSVRGAALTFENAGLGIGFTAAANLVREFVLRKVTHGVADFNQGDKAIPTK